MDERSGTDTPHRSPRTTRSFRVAGFPGWTHLIATLAFAAWHRSD